MAELALLHDTSADEDGFFICGDTAQTITRGVAYDAFEDYLRKKRRHRLYDVCDVVFHLFTQVRQGEVRHSPLHRVIIDEVQDLTMAELALLHDAATDKDGLFGDAARLRERERDDPLSLDV